MLSLSRVGVPLLSPPRRLFDAAQGARRYVAIWVLHGDQARSVHALKLVVLAFNTRQIPAFGFHLINICLLSMVVIQPA